MGGTIVHVNAVGLMAAIEESRDAGLRTRPFVVAREGAPRAVVLDVSPAAHREGVARGMLLGMAQRRVPGLRVVAPAPALYGEADEAMWKIGMSFTPLVERAGKGHLFIDLAGTSRLFGAPADAARRLRARILDELGIAPSIALASGKTVTKVASRVFRPGGFTVLMPYEERDIVRLQPVELLPGVGPALRDRLTLLDIDDIGGIADLGAFEARAIGPRGPDLVARARCVDESPVNPEPPERRCLHDAAVLEPDSAEPELLRLHIARLAAGLGYEARKENLGVRTVTVRIEYSDGRPVCASSRSPRLLVRDEELAAAGWDAARRAMERRVRVRRIAVEFSAFGAAGPELDLFEPAEAKAVKLQTALDRVHSKYGFPALAPCAFLCAGLTSPRFAEGEA